MKKIKIGQEWLDRLMPEGFPVSSSTIISGPGGTGKPLIGFMVVSSWLEQGGSVVFMPLQYPSRAFTVTTLKRLSGLEVGDYADKIAFIVFDPTISFTQKISKDTIKANLLKSEVWEKLIEEASNLVKGSELGTIIFGSALNLLLFSKTYKDSILTKLKDVLENSKNETYLFSVSTTAFRDEVRILENAADNLMFTKVEKSLKLYFSIIRMKDVKFLSEEVIVPLSKQVWMDIKEVAHATMTKMIPTIRKI